MRIAWFSALPIDSKHESLRSAYFSDLVLPELQSTFDIEVFHNSFDSYKDFNCHHYLAAFLRHKENAFDCFVYQLEDHPLAQFARVSSLLFPGVIYFHDFVFTSFGPEPILNSPWQKIQNKFKDQDLDWPIRDEKHFQSGPFAHREASFAAIALFSNSAQHTQFKNQVSQRLLDQQVSYYLPLPVAKSSASYEMSSRKQRIGFCGSPQIEFRSHKLLAAVSNLGHEYELVWLLDEQEIDHAEQLIQEFGINSVSLVIGRNPASWSSLVEGLDVGVHTAFSVYKQNEPYLGISLMRGLPCITSDFGPIDAIPDDTVFKIEAGSTESYQIEQVLQNLFEGTCSWDYQNAREFAAERYSLAAVVNDLQEVFIRNRSLLQATLERWENFEDLARTALLEEARAACNGDNSQIYYGVQQSSKLRDSNFVYQQICEPVFKELGWL